MIDTKKFRKVNKNEYAIITNSVLKISTKILSVLKKIDYKIYIVLVNKTSKNNYPSIYLIPNNLTKDLVNFQQEINVNSAGLYLGFIKKGEFYLSLEGAEFLCKKGILSAIKFLYVNKKGEKSILYGNNILKNMILKIPSNIQKEDYLLIFNELNEILALAQSKVESNNIKHLNPEDLVAFNLSDKGIYLRKKQ